MILCATGGHIFDSSKFGKEAMAMQTFVNLPVTDLAKAIEFFTALGFSVDHQSSDESTARVVVNDQTSVMLMVKQLFEASIEPQQIADTSRTREVIIGLSAESREQVDRLAAKAVAAGAQSLGEPVDQGLMYMQGFRDLDGHQWSFIYIDTSANPQG